MSNFIPNENGLQIDWQDSEYPMCVFPVDAFEKECSNVKSYHTLHYSNGDINQACYYKTVKGNQAEIDYKEGLNDEDEVDSGLLTLIFKDDSRKKVEHLTFTLRDHGITSW